MLNDQMMVVMNSFGGMGGINRNVNETANAKPIMSAIPPIVNEEQNN